ISLDGFFRVAGTKRYKAVNGAARTVFLVSPLSKEEVVKREAAELAERKRREAQEQKDREAREEVEAAERLRELRLATVRKEAARREAADRKAEAKAKAKRERPLRAAAKLKRIKDLLRIGKTDRAITRLYELVKEYPGTPAAKEAERLIKRYSE